MDTEALSFEIPTMMNQPRQIFGRYHSDGSPVPPSASMAAFQDDPSIGTGDEVNDAKRRRIARACDMCRKKKIKCDGKMPKCSHCINYKTECVFTTVEKKRNPPKGAKYIEGLENRLGRMEALLRVSGLLSEEDAGKTDLGTLEKRLADRSIANDLASRNQRTSSSTNARSQSAYSTPRVDSQSSPQTSVESPESQKGSQNEIEELSDMMCSLVTNNSGETRYIGSSSGFSIFSPRGIQWVNRQTGDTSFQDMLSAAAVDDNKWLYWKPEIFSDIFARRIFKPLPPKEEAFSLFKDYFDNFNYLFPLFHAPTFMHLAERQYSKDPYEGSGWWASLNVVLAIAHRLRVMSNLVPQDEDKKAWLYLKNAMAVLTELTMRNTDLLSVQALLGMCLFLQGTPNPQPAFCLVAAAIRLSHSIGLHKRGSAFGLNVVEAEQRKRVFWIAYLMDKDICLRSGRPPMQDDDDMNVELPSEDPPDNIGNVSLSDGKGQLNLFRVMCRFAIIQSKVYKRLYSTKAAKQSDGELLNTIGELDKELEDWKETIPLEYRPENEIKASHTPLVIPLVVLHFSYYNCLTTIHRMSVHHGYWTSRLSNYALQGLNARPLNPRVFSSATLCVNAARSSINLIKYIPQGDFACVWLIIYYPVSALVTLFANILQNPQDTRARSDIKLMNLVVNFLSNLVSDESNGSVKRMLCICSEFERMAKVVLDKAEKESHSRRKRKIATENTSLDSQRDLPGDLPPSPASLPPQPDAQQTTPPFSSIVSEPSDGNMFSPPIDGLPPVSDSTLPSSGEDSTANLQRMPEFNYDFHNVLSSTAVDQVIFDGQQPYLNNGAAMSNTSFQQSFVPQDLWQMPMTIEWDWSNSAFPSLENEEIFGDPMRDGQYT